MRGALPPKDPKPPLLRGSADGARGGVAERPPNEPKERLLLAGVDFPEENPLLNELDFDGFDCAATSVTTGSISASSSAILKDFIIFLEPL